MLKVKRRDLKEDSALSVGAGAEWWQIRTVRAETVPSSYSQWRVNYDHMNPGICVHLCACVRACVWDMSRLASF